jgi:hypothetical protein
VATTGAKYPTANAAHSGGLTNPTSAYDVDETDYASLAAVGAAVQHFYGFGFAIPAGVTITGLVLRARAKRTATAGATFWLKNNVGDTELDSTEMGPTTSAATYTHTATTFPTVAQLNDDAGTGFNLQFVSSLTTAGQGIYVYWLTAEVTYTLPGGGLLTARSRIW